MKERIKEDGTHKLIVVHVICSAGNTSVIQTTLVDELEEVVDAWKDIVHEHYGIKVLVLSVSQLVEGYKGSVSNFGEILDAVVERTARALRCSDGNPQTNGASKSVKNTEERLCLVGRAILVDGHKNVVITKESRDAEESRKEVWNDVEGIVKVDSKEVLVLSAREVAPMAVVRCLFLARTWDWVQTTEAKIIEPRLGRGRVVADEGGVTLARLLRVQGIEILSALTSVVR